MADLSAVSFCSGLAFKSLAYTEAFRVFTLIMTVFRLGVAGELYERICEHFPGIGRFRVGLAAVLVLIAGLLTVFTFRPDLVDQLGVSADRGGGNSAVSE